MLNDKKTFYPFRAPSEKQEHALEQLATYRANDITKSLTQTTSYILNDYKTTDDGIRYTAAYNCHLETAAEDFIQTKRFFGKENGRWRYHWVVSFKPGETTPTDAFAMVKLFVEKTLANRFEVVTSLHTDKDHLHGHIVFNSVSFVDGKKYRYEKGDWKQTLQPILNTITESYGLSVLPAEYAKNKDHTPSHRQTLEMLLDELLLKKPKDLQELFFLLKQKNVTIITKQDGSARKHISVLMPGAKRHIRLDSLSTGYTQEDLEKRISGEMIFTPKQRPGKPSIKRSNKSFQKSRRTTVIKKIYWPKNVMPKTYAEKLAQQTYIPKSEFVKFREVQTKRNYMIKHKIRTGADLINHYHALYDKEDALEKQFHKLFKARYPHKEELELARLYYQALKEGLYTFAEVYKRNMKNDPKELLAFQEHFNATLAMLNHQKRELKKEQALMSELAKENFIPTKDLERKTAHDQKNTNEKKGTHRTFDDE